MAASSQNAVESPVWLQTFQSAAVAVSNGTAMNVLGLASLAVQVTIATTATITFEGTVDDSTWESIEGIKRSDGSLATTATATGLYTFSVAGLSQFRCRISAWTAGAVTAVGIASNKALLPQYDQSVTVSGTVDVAEFPAAAALADNTANPTTTLIGSMAHLWDGATWDRAPGDATNGLKVQPAVGGAGAVTAQTERMTLASDDPAVVALQVIDDWDESDRAKVNLVVGQAGITAGAGAVAANTPRATLASDDPAVVALQVIDDWDESDRAKVNPIVGQAGVQGGAGAVSATTQRVAIATDANAVASATHDSFNANANLQIADADASATNPVPTQARRAATSAVTTVADSASSGTLIATNANRMGFVITNDSSARLYVKFGATASTTSYTVSLAQNETYESPAAPVYTGVIDGIWSSDPGDGAARCTELTA